MNLIQINKKTLIIGIGNEFRKDDALGLIVARRLEEILSKNIEIIETDGEGTKLLELWKYREKVFIIDAVNTKNKAGTIYRLDVSKEQLNGKFFNYSTHAFSLAEAVEVGRKLNQLPSQFVIYGIEGKTFEQGIGVSIEVEAAIEEVVEKILAEIKT